MHPNTNGHSTARTLPKPRTYALGVGLPWAMITGLALLGVPRVALHDLHLIDGFILPGLLAIAPPLIWVTVVHRRRAHNPVLTCIAIGMVFGPSLAITHQLLWNEAFEGETLRLGGNLSDLSTGAQEAVFRTAAFASSNGVGLAVGAACGFVAWALERNRSDA